MEKKVVIVHVLGEALSFRVGAEDEKLLRQAAKVLNDKSLKLERTYPYMDKGKMMMYIALGECLCTLKRK